MSASVEEPGAPVPIGTHVTRTLRLALPVMLGRAGILVMVAVDTAMVGHAGAEALAAYGLGLAPQVPLLLVGIGMLMSTVVLTAQAHGAGEFRECGAVWRVGAVHALVYGLGLVAVTRLGEPFLRLTGQSESLAAAGGEVLAVLGWGLPGMLLYTVTTLFLEGIGRPAPSTVVMLLANGLNALLNWVFIYGHLGAPALGAEGAALSTSLVRWFMVAALLAYVLLRVDPDAFGLRGAVADARALGRRLRRIGYPMALSQGLEASAFATLTLFAGLLGATQVAGFQIAMNLIAIPFMCALGFATAAAVRVGNAVGRGDAHGVRLAGWVAAGLAVALLGAVGIAYRLAPQWLVAVYTGDPQAAAVAVSAVLVAAFVLAPDGLQAVLMGALRSTGDVWPATGFHFLSFWVLMMPLAYGLGVARGHGAPGLMSAVVAGCACSAVLLGARFAVVSRRAPRRAR